jgi:hypothetical protein
MLTYTPATGEFLRGGKVAGNIHAHGYRVVRAYGKQHKAHRLAHYFMTGRWPRKQCDHINGVRDDNRWCNLRWVSPRENSLNAKRMKNNTSGVTGLSWHKKNECWMVRINTEQGAEYLGSYYDYFEAVCARKSAEVTHGYHANHDRRAA